MPSRPVVSDELRTLRANGSVGGRRITVNLTQRAGARSATGVITIEGEKPIATLGVLQTSSGWAAVTAIDDAGRALMVIVDEHDPTNQGGVTIAIDANGAPWLRGSLPRSAIALQH